MIEKKVRCSNARSAPRAAHQQSCAKTSTQWCGRPVAYSTVHGDIHGGRRLLVAEKREKHHNLILFASTWHSTEERRSLKA